MTRFFPIANGFSTTYIFRNLTAQGKFRQCIWVRAVGRCFARRNQLICSCYRIVDISCYFEQYIWRQFFDRRPWFNGWAIHKFSIFIRFVKATIYLAFIRFIIIVVSWHHIIIFDISSRRQCTTVNSRSCYGTGVKKCNGRNLTIPWFRTFTIREVTCRMTTTESRIIRCIACAEARATEGCTHDGTSAHKVYKGTIFHKF